MFVVFELASNFFLNRYKFFTKKNIFHKTTNFFFIIKFIDYFW